MKLIDKLECLLIYQNSEFANYFEDYVDTSDRIGGRITSHCYLILSNQMHYLSEFEEGTGLGLPLTKRV